MKPGILIIGAGGHARVVTAIARRMDAWVLSGILDRTAPAQPESIDHVRVVGGFADAETYLSSGIRHAALAVGDNAKRAALFAQFSALGFTFPVLRHPTAIIEDNAVLGAGCVLCAGAIIGAGVSLGEGVIVNTGAIIDHETSVGNFAHLAPGTKVAGRVRIGSGSMLGIGSCVREKIAIGVDSIVGAGSVVVADIADRVVAYGIPARAVRALPDAARE